jgi:hypothetical protein
MASGSDVRIGPDNVFVVDGKPAFPIGFTLAPPAGGKTPGGGDAYAELKSNGTVFHRCGPKPGEWGAKAEAELDHILARSAATGLLAAISIPDLQAIPADDTEKAKELRRVVTKYAGHAGLGFWKGTDEPQWGKVPVALCRKFYEMVHQIDRRHPVWITQAPRGALEELKEYDPTYDVGAIDIYPVGYPPGLHSHLPNKNVSVVGDYANWMKEITAGKKPFWMVLQICWSGVARPGKTLRFPTFAEERYMAYQAIINGARGLVFFGGDVQAGLNRRDAALGWNWTFYYKILKPVLDELNPAGPLFPALLAPESKLPVKLEGISPSDLEFCIREAGGHVFLMAAKREGATVEARFSGLPFDQTTGDVLYEEPRQVSVSKGSFTDWFGPNEVHIYRFSKQR